MKFDQITSSYQKRNDEREKFTLGYLENIVATPNYKSNDQIVSLYCSLTLSHIGPLITGFDEFYIY